MSTHRGIAILATAPTLVSSPARAEQPWLLWQEAISGPGSDYAFGVTVDGNNDVIVTGAFSKDDQPRGQ